MVGRQREKGRGREIEITYMQTKRRTLSSSGMIPALVNPSQISTPITGISSILPTASELIAPRGSVRHSPFLGIGKRANDEPRHIRPRGTEAAPIKLVVSIMKASGGCPSGAEGI